MTAPHPKTFRDLAPQSWRFHRHTSRWMFNLINPGADEIPEPGAEFPAAPFTKLPPPGRLDTRMHDAIAARTSCRDFDSAALSAGQLSAILHYSFGTLSDRQLGNLEVTQRPCPSPGGLYPLETYVIARRVDGVEPGVHHYHSQTHSLALMREGIPPIAFESYLFMGQDYAANAAATLVLTFCPSRSLKKYADRGYRYALIEAGHVGQNIALATAALDLGCCPLGGFLDVELGQYLKVDPEREFPLYALAVGPKATRQMP
jgi:SagB-type dehydrogenase family enzyme